MQRLVLTYFIAFLAHSCVAQHLILSEDFSAASGHALNSTWEMTLINGVAAVDSFYFEDSLYKMALPIEAPYALFDSYNGGQVGGTNGNSQGEQVALLTPYFSSRNLNNLYLSFDYFLTSFSSSGLYVDITTDSSTWTTLWSQTNSISTPINIEVNLGFYTNQDSVRLRFRWNNPNTIGNQGYGVFDNIQVYEQKQFDVSVGAVLEPVTSACAISEQALSVEILNAGYGSLTNVPLEMKVSGLLSANYSDTLASLSAGASWVWEVDSINTAASGTLTLEIGSHLSGDSVLWNNERTLTLQTADSASTPVGVGSNRCGAGSLQLSASADSNELSLWFDQASGGNLLSIGSVLQTPVIGQTKVFYVENAETIKQQLSTYQGPWRYNGIPTGGSYFNVQAKHPILIDSFFQLCAYAATQVVITVYTKDGSYLGSERNSSDWEVLYLDTMDTPGWGKYIGLDIEDQFLQTGDQQAFYITVNGGASPTFKQLAYDEANSDLILTSNAINNLAFGNYLTGYSWDGIVNYKRLCISPRTAVTAEVLARPLGAHWIEDSASEGEFNKGNSNDPDLIQRDKSIAYSLVAPSNYPWVDYGTTWTIQGLEISTPSGASIPTSDTSFVVNNSGANAQLTYTPSASWVDSLLSIRVRIRSMDNLCDTVFERLLYVAHTPLASFSSSDVCLNEWSYFTNNSTLAQGTMQYKWYFGDGDSSIQKQAVHRYEQHGSYTVQLIATSELGIEDDTSLVVEVFEIPEVNFEVINACEGKSLQFTNQSQISTGSMEYDWDFGDTSTSQQQHPSHTYNSAGEYAVTLEVQANGCTNSKTNTAYQFASPVADFSYKGHCEGTAIEFQNESVMAGQEQTGAIWFFEPTAAIQTGNKPSYTYSSDGFKQITLIAISQFDCRDTLIRTLAIDPAPDAQFTWDRTCDQTPTQFNNITTEPLNFNTSYLWDLGDGSQSKLFEPLKQYNENKEYTVTLTATSSDLCSDQRSKTFFVGRQPIADFEIHGNCENEAVQFVNRTTNTFGSIDFHWEFGDGDSSNTFNSEHSYQVDQYTIYQVQLTALVNNGCHSTKAKQVGIEESPHCGFSVEQSETDRQEFHFIPDVNTYAHYTWVFEGDGTSFEVSPVHRFTYSDWQYKVHLIAETNLGCKCSDSTVDITTSWPLSIPALQSTWNISLYPNPANKEVTLQLDERLLNRDIQITLINALGQDLQHWQLNSPSTSLLLPLNNLASGVYQLQLHQGGKQLVIPLIIQ